MDFQNEKERVHFLKYLINNFKINQNLMKSNMGSADKAIRIVLAIVFAGLYITQLVEGTIGVVLLVLGGIFLLTSIISFCPLYTILGINTCEKKK